ncbi:MAG: tetratricopeptide repeat protein [Bacteroidota bacterium]
MKIASVFILLFIFITPLFSDNIPSIDSLKAVLKTSDNKALTCRKLSDLYAAVHPDSSLLYAEMAYELAEKEGNLNIQADALCQIGDYHYDQGELDEALTYFEQALSIDTKTGNDTSIASDLNLIGTVYEGKSEYDKALEYYNKSLDINKKIDCKPGLANNYNNIGMIYYNWGEFDEAIEHYKMAIELDSIIGRENTLAIDYNNLGLSYCYKGDYETAIVHFRRALFIDRKIGNETALSPFLNNIGLVYYYWDKTDSALFYFQEAVNLSERLGNLKDVVTFKTNIGAIYVFKLGNYYKGFKMFDECRDICIANDYKHLLQTVYGSYYKAHLKREDYKSALEYYKLYTSTRDSIFDDESRKTMDKFRAKYETEKKEKEIEILKRDQEIKTMSIKKRNIIIYANTAGIILVLIFGIVIFRAYRQKKKAFLVIKEQKEQIEEKNEELNQQNEEIAAQRDEIVRQKNQLEFQNQQITDSIHYAKRIQKAVLPPEEYVNKSLPEHFILFIPRDIVSGDFYWAKSRGDDMIIAAADCTGHGVPGAFMSMLGVAFLNEIISRETILNAGLVLDMLKAQVIKSLHQTGKEGESQDGMDIALCIINEKHRKMQFAGANNPLWIVRLGELTEVSPDKMPIGIFDRAKGFFSCHDIPLQSGDQLYIFSDGFQDQFGGPKERKFGKGRMQEKLTEISTINADQQKEIMKNLFYEWKGEQKQMDDVLLIGIKIT